MRRWGGRLGRGLEAGLRGEQAGVLLRGSRAHPDDLNQAGLADVCGLS